MILEHMQCLFTEQGSSASQMTAANLVMSLQDHQTVMDKQPTQYLRFLR